MPIFVALLRGINVGKAKRVSMEALRAVLGGLGYTKVATLLNSGNLVFLAAGGTPAQHAAAIAEALATQLQLDVPVIVKSAKEFASVVAENRLAGAAFDPSRLLLAFIGDAQARSDVAAIAQLTVAPEVFFMGTHAAYLLCSNGILESKAGKALLGKGGKARTSRNWATVLKLQALVREVAGPA